MNLATKFDHLDIGDDSTIDIKRAKSFQADQVLREGENSEVKFGMFVPKQKKKDILKQIEHDDKAEKDRLKKERDLHPEQKKELNMQINQLQKGLHQTRHERKQLGLQILDQRDPVAPQWGHVYDSRLLGNNNMILLI